MLTVTFLPPLITKLKRDHLTELVGSVDWHDLLFAINNILMIQIRHSLLSITWRQASLNSIVCAVYHITAPSTWDTTKLSQPDSGHGKNYQSLSFYFIGSNILLESDLNLVIKYTNFKTIANLHEMYRFMRLIKGRLLLGMNSALKE